MEGFKIFDLNMYPLDTENLEVGMIGYHNNKVYIYLDDWVEITELYEEEEVYDKKGNKIGIVKGDTFYDFRMWLGVYNMNETTLITIKDAAKAIAPQTVFSTEVVEDMLRFAILNGIICGFDIYVNEEETN